MFTNLEITNFKCLRSFSRDLGGLTLLTGLNASGKSSVAQALGVVRQTAQEDEWGRALQLNGSTVQLGTMFDVIDRTSGGSGFVFAISTKHWRIEWETTSVDRKRDLAAQIKRIKVTIGDLVQEWMDDELKAMAVRRLVPEIIAADHRDVYNEMQSVFASIVYIGAERIGPREVYVAQRPLLLPDVGPRGEQTPWCLEQFADADINPALALPGVANKVRLTVQAWMSQLFPGFQATVNRMDVANLVTVSIRTSPRGDFFRPTNVGFGLTHVLPIVTACVAAKYGQLIIVENPETHLHPAGQSQIGSFLAQAAAGGAQLIVETHSDHVLNGVRRAVRDRTLSADAATIYFFTSVIDEKGDSASSSQQIHFEESGRLSGWPDGFFDQLEADLDHISGE